MRPDFWLTIKAEQRYEGRDPEIYELGTEAELTDEDGVLFLRYRESALSGMEGFTTTFEIHRDQVILRRNGPLNLEMVLQAGQFQETLYGSGRNVTLLTIRTLEILDEMTVEGGTLTLAYEICLGRRVSGVVKYSLEVRRCRPAAGGNCNTVTA